MQNASRFPTNLDAFRVPPCYFQSVNLFSKSPCSSEMRP